MVINIEDKTILETLDQIIKDPKIMKFLIPLVEEARNEKYFPVTKTVLLSLFENKLPKQINLCRIFILGANTKSKIEKHKNSFQRTVTIFGLGDTKVLNNNIWVSNIRKADGKTIKDRWLSVLENTWHQPISGQEDWITVTFHTASEDQIIDEYND